MAMEMFVRFDLGGNQLSFSTAAAEALKLKENNNRVDVFYNKQTLRVAVIPSQTGKFNIRYSRQYRMYIGHLIRMLPAFYTDRRYECEKYKDGIAFTLERRRKNG